MKQTSAGFTLIEVLIAMLILSLGLLGIAGTLLTGTRSSNSNYLRQQAVQYAYDIVDRMHANPAAANDVSTGNPYIVALAAPAATVAKDCTSVQCSAAEMATYDVWQWQTQLKDNLPDGLGSVAVAASGPGAKIPQITVNVTWNDKSSQATFSDTASGSYSVVTAL